MPMDFPDMNSLRRAAECHKFREPTDGEGEMEYRSALADHVKPIDLIESMEIRTGKGWNRFSDTENRMMLGDKLLEPKEGRDETGT